jgi:hypothetical protein
MAGEHRFIRPHVIRLYSALLKPRKPEFMATRRHPACVLIPLMFTLLISACAGNAPKGPAVNFSDSFDFSVVSRVAFAPQKAPAAGAEELSEELSSRIYRGLEGALRDKGIHLTSNTAEAELVLHWQLSIQEKVDVRSYDFFGYRQCWRCGPSKSDVSTEEYTQRTFIVDMIEPGRGQSVWRGVMQARIDAEREATEAGQMIDTACMEMLADFPPKPKPSPLSGLLTR